MLHDDLYGACLESVRAGELATLPVLLPREQQCSENAMLVQVAIARHAHELTIVDETAHIVVPVHDRTVAAHVMRRDPHDRGVDGRLLNRPAGHAGVLLCLGLLVLLLLSSTLLGIVPATELRKRGFVTQPGLLLHPFAVGLPPVGWLGPQRRSLFGDALLQLDLGLRRFQGEQAVKHLALDRARAARPDRLAPSLELAPLLREPPLHIFGR